MGQWRLARVLKHLSRLGATVTIRPTAGCGDAQALAAAASPDAFDVVVAVGGDGTINELVNSLTGKELALGVIPLATTSVLAAEIGMPARSRAIAEMIVSGASEPVYVGAANGRRFVMVVGVGFDAHVVRRVSTGLVWLRRLLYK